MSLLSFWRRHYRDIPRIRQIIAVASRHGFGHLIEQLGLQRFISLGRRILTFKKQPPPEHRLSTPERLRLMFEELGPSFIKLGQVLSCRPDMLPPEYALELCKLTDSVSPFPFREARDIVEKDLGAPLDKIFAEFDPVPAAAASIAQVHGATLFDGRAVMVKVQRPNIERVISRDISILRGLAELIEAYVPDMAVYNPRGIVEEFARTISRELDFFIEASSALRLRTNFEKSPIVYIPQVFPDLSSKRVLVIERLGGIRIDEVERLAREGFDLSDIAKKGAAAYFQMVLQDGFFHADPHPGNIFVLSDGRIGLVDFGIMGRVTEENMEYFANVFVALVRRDFDMLVQQYLDMGFMVEEMVDIDAFRRELKADIEELLEPYYGMKAKQIDFAAYVERVTDLLLRHRLKLPQNLYLVDKTLITLEGLLRRVDPEFDYLDSAKPYVTRLISMRRDPRRVLRTVRKNAEDMYTFLGALPRQLQTSLRKFARGDIRIKVQHEELHTFIRDIDKSSNRIAFSVITAAIIVASSIIIHSGQGEKIFGLPVFGMIGYVVAAFLGVWILIGIMRSGQL